ncbi:MAG: glutamate formimidoyltransferase [Phototrophicales bacterium]|nr:MAG: glutamate formimidoyltransferase [Phototrophicales bacterium]
MSQSALIECVPNFSEGRRTDVITQITAAARTLPVHVLDVSSDADHNRTVVTIAGSPEVVMNAAFAMCAAAASMIDLDIHHGVHPRIGATDVIPFVPLRGITLETCVELARQLGRRIADELGLPVYLYEAAALRPERRNLAAIRRGGYEALKTAIESDPDRAPDYGVPKLGRAGAVAVGARMPLIAFNAYLNTDDVQVARLIAETIRESGGGLKHVKALGLLVGGRAQVSMNLTDYRQTGLFAVMQAVIHQAAQHGAVVERTELVGLIPQEALINYAVDALGLPAHARLLTLERRLGEAMGDYRPILFDEQ